jgi:hypothetical protein
MRTGADHEIDIPVTVTPLGAVARLEHALEGFEGDRERYRQRLNDARRRLVSYQSRGEGEFAYAEALAEKHRQLAEIERALALDIDGSAAGEALAA